MLLLLSFFSCHTLPLLIFSFFFNDTATTEIYTLSLHDALPIYSRSIHGSPPAWPRGVRRRPGGTITSQWEMPSGREGWRSCRDRKSTRLNSSHGYISYAVFCLKKKKISMLFKRLRRHHNRPRYR